MILLLYDLAGTFLEPNEDVVNMDVLLSEDHLICLPRISKMAVFIWPTSTQHLAQGRNGHLDSVQAIVS